MPPPAHSLRLCLEDDGLILDTIQKERKRRGTEWKRTIWSARRTALRAEALRSGDTKRAIFLRTTSDDLERTLLNSPAAYLHSSVGDKQKLALLQLRSQSTLLAADSVGDDDEPEDHCDACHTHLGRLQDTLRRLQTKIPPAAALQIMEVEEELKNMNTVLQNDPPEIH
jgi:hypothetical protein